MFAIRQIIDDPQEVIAIPPELRHRRTEVIFIALDYDKQTITTVNTPRADWFKNYKIEDDIDFWESLSVDDSIEDEWEW
jgi:hypothetical protein